MDYPIPMQCTAAGQNHSTPWHSAVADLMAGTGTVVVPHGVVVDRLRSTTLVMGVDIETADWVDRHNSTSKGQFGFFF